MSTAHERLAEARSTRYASARQAAIALGITYSTYQQYEAGVRGFSRHAERFSRFFHVDLNWLITGRGDMRRKGGPTIPVTGIVTAGGQTIDAQQHEATPSKIALPDMTRVAALLVVGDSQYPRFQDGEWIIYDTNPVKPSDAVNHFAIVDTTDGRRMLKLIREGRTASSFTLESINARPERDVELLCAYKYVGVIAKG